MAEKDGRELVFMIALNYLQTHLYVIIRFGKESGSEDIAYIPTDYTLLSALDNVHGTIDKDGRFVADDQPLWLFEDRAEWERQFEDAMADSW